MSTYSIQYLEQLTGVKAHTIRIWEQRYQLLNPERNAANIRSYNDDDLKKILAIATLIHSGYKISDVASLPTDAIHQRVQEIQHPEMDNDITDYAHINDLIAAAMSFDEDEFEKIYKKIIRKNGVEHTYLHIIHPLLVRIGSLWNIDQLVPSQEHFISNLIRKKFFVATDACKIIPGSETWILFLPENEDHEIGLLFSNFLLRYYGKKTIYLGQRVPVRNIADVIKSTGATGILCFQVVNSTQEHNSRFLHELNALPQGITKILCSAPFVYKKDELCNIKNITNPTDFINWIKKPI